MKVNFVGDGVGIYAQRRRQAYRNHACESCRVRKKRCEHPSPENVKRNRTAKRKREDTALEESSLCALASICERSSADAGNDEDTFQRIRQVSASNEDELSDLSEGTSRVFVISCEDAFRFVGDLSPEAIFHEPVNCDELQHNQDHDRVGTWLKSTPKGPGAPDGLSLDISTDPFLHSTQPTLYSRLNDECVSVLPSESHLNALVSIYFSNIHPLLPLLDEAEFRRSYVNGTASVQLLQAICLVSSKDIRAKKALHLSGMDLTSRPREFAQQLYTALSCALWLRLETNKVRLIQLLSLISLHSEGSEGWEESSLHLAQAVQLAQTIGLHIGRPQIEQDSGHMTRLFCSLWSLDRMNAAMRGRPIMMQDIDIGKELRASLSQQKSTFGVWMHISMMLDNVIELYRPDTDLSKSGWEDDFPDFEAITSKHDASRMNSRLLVTCELFYHAVSILSCRLRDSRFKAPSSKASYIRQILSTFRIIAMTGSWRHHSPVPLPILPYAISLSMSVAFRKFRQSDVPMHRTQAQDDLRAGCTALSKLIPYFWIAEAMSNLGLRTLHEMDELSRRSSDSRSRRGVRLGEKHETVDAMAKSNVSQEDIVPDLDLQPHTPSTDFTSAFADSLSVVETQPFMMVPATPPSTIEYAESQYEIPIDGLSYPMDVFDNLSFEYVDGVLAEQLNLSFPINYMDYFPL